MASTLLAQRHPQLPWGTRKLDVRRGDVREGELARQAARYGVAVAASVAAILVKSTAAPLIGAVAPFVLLFIPVVLSAWLGGVGPAVVSIGICAGAAMVFFLPPLTEGGVAPLVTFLVEGTGVALLSAALERARRNASEARVELLQQGAALRESHERFSVLVSAVTEYAIYLLDPSGRIQTWNKGAERLMGYSEQEVLGQHVSLFLAEDDRSSGRVQNEFGLAVREGVARDEAWRVRKDRSRFWADVTVTAIKNPDATLRGFAMVVRDMTDRRRAEQAIRDTAEQMKAILDSAADGIITVDERGIIHTSNPAAVSLFSYAPDEMHGRNVHTLIPECDAEELERWAQRRLTGTAGAEATGRRKDGNAFPLEIAVSEVRLTDRRMFTLMARDITDRRRAEEALRRAKEDLEVRVRERTRELSVANKELEAFSYSVSHDLRAPLRALEAFSKLLLERHSEGLEAQAQHYLHRIRAAAQRMAQLIDDLLRLSRVSRTDLKRSDFNFSELANEVAQGVARDLNGRTVDVEIQPSIQCNADPQLLRVVLENLIGNAFKFTAKAERAAVQVGAVTDGGRKVYFVRDNGAGFDMAYADKLFAPFQRLHDQSEFEGSGIGLATVQRVLALHGGQIWAVSAPGKGATLHFTLGETT